MLDLRIVCAISWLFFTTAGLADDHPVTVGPNNVGQSVTFFTNKAGERHSITVTPAAGYNFSQGPAIAVDLDKLWRKSPSVVGKFLMLSMEGHVMVKATISGALVPAAVGKGKGGNGKPIPFSVDLIAYYFTIDFDQPTAGRKYVGKGSKVPTIVTLRNAVGAPANGSVTFTSTLGGIAPATVPVGNNGIAASELTVNAAPGSKAVIKADVSNLEIGSGEKASGSKSSQELTLVGLEISPVSMLVVESKDSELFTATVSPATITGTYEWKKGSAAQWPAQPAWPSTAANDPALNYSAPTANKTLVKNTRWFAPNGADPNRRLRSVNGATCVYNINCEVTLTDGTKLISSPSGQLFVRVPIGGSTSPPFWVKHDTISTASREVNGVTEWFVDGQGDFKREGGVMDLSRLSETSQFLKKLKAHENKHSDQIWKEEPWKSLFDADNFYKNTLKLLTASTKADLELKIAEAVLKQSKLDLATFNDKANRRAAEAGAFAASDAEEPHFLEWTEEQWKAIYGLE